MRVYTYITQSNLDNRFKFLANMTNVLPGLEVVSRYQKELKLNEIIQDPCDLFIVHKSDVTDERKLKDLCTLPIKVVLVSDGIIHTKQSGNCIELNTNLLRRFFPALLRNYGEKGSIDLNLLKGGWYQYYREIRDEFLDLYYDKKLKKLSMSPTLQPDRSIDDYLKPFKKCRGYDDFLNKLNNNEVNFVYIRDTINGFIVNILNSKELD